MLHAACITPGGVECRGEPPHHPPSPQGAATFPSPSSQEGGGVAAAGQGQQRTRPAVQSVHAVQ